MAKPKSLKIFSCPFCKRWTKYSSLLALNTHIGKAHRDLNLTVKLNEKLQAYLSVKLRKDPPDYS